MGRILFNLVEVIPTYREGKLELNNTLRFLTLAAGC